LVFIAKRWAKGFGREDKDVRKEICVCVCARARAHKKRKERKRKGEKDPRQGKKDIMRDDKSSEDQVRGKMR
jgi:hypothetical protein